MANIFRRNFSVLDISGKIYMSWTLDAKIHLNAMSLIDTIKNDNKTSDQDKDKAMIFLCHHLDEGLKMEYLTIKDPLTLWNNLKERYDHLKMVILPQARNEWTYLRFQDFKNVTEYNSAMFRIKLKFDLCGESMTDHDMIEKILSTFHSSSMVLQQQYREMDFKKYSELIGHLLVAEQHNDLLIKNNKTWPPGTAPFPEDNRLAINNNPQHQLCKKRGKAPEVAPRTNPENRCYRYGGKGHWERTCRTPKHLVKLYQTSLKKPENDVETNFLLEDNDEPMDLKMSDFFAVPEE
ncbi:uncharacterized protein LOC124885908 [Capsicum annuum]|uniref:uncharacterized protein LOC124885908 n=1 Tax=Capsicum annuum TaxID=4072 RepID=UPI001FB15AF6|nr:uncharacterized protein LOC124885908 [Capsicum annuum]